MKTEAASTGTPLTPKPEIIYEDNHLIIVNKPSGLLVQGDRSGDMPLQEIVRAYLKDKYGKPGNVFCGVVHRIDRPAQGLVIFAKTSKALTRLNEMLRRGEIHKTYLTLVEGTPARAEAELSHYLVSDPNTNRTRLVAPTHTGARDGRLHYRVLGRGEHYSLIAVRLFTGRKHQIRCQMSSIGTPIRGDLKYGARRSNRGGGISLLAWRLEFEHPVSHRRIVVEAPLPPERLWHIGDPLPPLPEMDGGEP